jgi:uncharacterized membrane protein required for colicin V production
MPIALLDRVLLAGMLISALLAMLRGFIRALPVVDAVAIAARLAHPERDRSGLCPTS